MKVKIYKNTFPQEWSSFISKNEKITPFMLQKFSIHDNLHLITICSKPDNEIIAGLTFRIRRTKYFLKYLWSDSSIFFNSSFDEKSRRLAASKLFRRLKIFAFSRFAILIKFSHWSRITDMKLFLENGFKTKKVATFEVDLSVTEEELFYNLKSDNRKKVRRAIRNGYEVFHYRGADVLSHIETIMTLHKKTYEKVNNLKPNATMTLRKESDVAGLIERFDQDTVLSLCNYNDKSIVVNLSFMCNGRVFPYVAGTDTDSVKNNGESNLLFWDLLKYLKQIGASFYDMGGVPPDVTEDNPAYGVYRFKKGFGGLYKEYYSGEWYLFNFLANIIRRTSIINKLKR